MGRPLSCKINGLALCCGCRPSVRLPSVSLTGTDNVLFEFTEYYKGVAQPHNANKDANIASEVDLVMTADNIMMNYVGYQVTVEDVDKCISKMKLHKAAYLDKHY